MDIVTLGAALNGSAEYVNSHFKGGSNIQIVNNPDGTQTINASGEVSSEDTVARAEIAEMKDGETLDSFGDVETALATKANADNVYKLALSNADLLPANTDLDNVKTVGCYYVYESTIASTITHKPTENTRAFRVTVELAAGKNRPRQIYQEFSVYDKYIRYETSNGTWANWKKVEGDLSTIYTKTEVDTALSAKQDTISDLSTIRSGAALGATAVQPETGKGLSTNDYTTAEKTKLAGIAEGAEVNVQSNWTQTTTTADDYIKNKPTLGTAAAKNATDTYNATGTDVTTGKAVAAALATLPEPMVFKGSLGTGGTITTLPTASSSNKGYVYKVITAGTYASQSAKVGDTFISDGSAWVLIPSGDEPSGTVTNVTVANGGGLTVSGSPITSSGTITVGHSNSVTAKTSSSVKKFAYDEYGHVTGSSELSTAESDALASGIDSTKVDQIETNKNNILLLQQKTAKVYGFHVNPNESDSSAAVTYLMDAVGMTPAKMGSTAFDWGSWADAFFIPKPCMVKPDGTVDYYLNPNNYAQKLDGTASELATAPTDNLLSNISYTNNAMMEWGKIWFKYEAGQADGEWSFYVSNMNVDGTFKCWCNINANNNEIDHFYTAIYNGVGCKSKMRSVSGVKLSTANEADATTAAQETAAAAANNATTNPEWYTEVWSDRLLINALLYLMGKSLDLQDTYGNGISSGGQTEKQNHITGSLDDKGLFYGDISGTTTAVKVFGMENLWACCWRRVAGCILDNNVLKVKMTYDTADGSSAHGYNLTGAGYLNFGSSASAEGWLSKITADSEKGYKPSGTQSNSSLYYKDYFYKNASIVAYLLLGGGSVTGANCGFDCNLSNDVSNANWSVSAALSLKRWG